MASDDPLWRPIDLKDWRKTPCISGRLADENDVTSGRAVFYLGNADNVGAHPVDVNLPICGILTDDSGTEIPVVVIQSERAEGKHYVGYRLIIGGSGICLIDEVVLLDSPDELFEVFA